MNEVTKHTIVIFFLEVLLTLVTFGMYPLIILGCKYAEYRDRKWEEEMAKASAEGARKRERAHEWVTLRNAVREIEAER